MTRSIVLAAALAALCSSVQAAPRVLLESPDAEVRMDTDLRCGRDAEVTVLARDPQLFSGGSPRMQSLLDATRAVLGFECRNIAGIVVSGRLAGLDETSYQAVAGPETDWRLKASRTVQVSALGGAAGNWTPPAAKAGSGGYTGSTPPAAASAGGNGYAVRDLQRGMGVEEALATARKTFAAEPKYDRERNVLSVVQGGCPVAGETLRRDFWPRAGDTCLEAGFGADGDERLQRLVFGQVVDMDQAATIRSALEQRYGTPAATSQPAAGTTRLGWGRSLPGDGERRELEAQIEVREGTTVLVIELAAAAEQPRYQADF